MHNDQSINKLYLITGNWSAIKKRIKPFYILIIINGSQEAQGVFSPWPDPISINSVLVIFRVSLFVFNQVCTWFKVAYVIIWICDMHVICLNTWFTVWKTIGKSFMYNESTSGPRMVPWRTPQVNTCLLDKDPLTEHCYMQFSKYNWNQ